MMRSLQEPKSGENGVFKEDDREIELLVLRKQPSKRKSDWQDSKPETGPDKHRTLKHTAEQREARQEVRDRAAQTKLM